MGNGDRDTEGEGVEKEENVPRSLEAESEGHTVGVKERVGVRVSDPEGDFEGEGLGEALKVDLGEPEGEGLSVLEVEWELVGEVLPLRDPPAREAVTLTVGEGDSVPSRVALIEGVGEPEKLEDFEAREALELGVPVRQRVGVMVGVAVAQVEEVGEGRDEIEEDRLSRERDGVGVDVRHSELLGLPEG